MMGGGREGAAELLVLSMEFALGVRRYRYLSHVAALEIKGVPEW